MSNSKRILVVDDEQDIVRGAQLWLSSAGYEMSSASDGVQAIATAIHDLPDAIVMDVRMPRKDGLTALAELRERSDTQYIPIVILSASLVDQQKALDAGASFFLTKPYVGSHLVAAVNAAVKKSDTEHACH